MVVASMSARAKPVAVLLGWLGCQPKNLRRFTDLYDKRGWDSFVRVASPESVIAAIQQGPSGIQVNCNGLVDYQSSKFDDKSLSEEMYDQAFDILHELQYRQCQQFIVHIFSNGGCFLWEWIAHILMQQCQRISWNNTCIDVQNLRSKLVGRVFDSAPANYEGRPDGILSALQHIKPIEDRNHLLNMARRVDASRVNVRHDEFWQKMRDDNHLAVPELYMCSKNDRLTSFAPLKQLIINREEVLGKENVRTHIFSDSDHCGHLLKYPEEYDLILGQFLFACNNKNAMVSKL